MEKIKLVWGLLRSKTYVVITDKVSVISLRMRNPKAFKSQMALLLQTAALQDFHEKLGELIEEHNQAVESLQGESDE